MSRRPLPQTSAFVSCWSSRLLPASGPRAGRRTNPHRRRSLRLPTPTSSAIAALPAEEQVEEVRKELLRRNPGFDGKVQHKIEDGVVTEFWIVTDQVTDIGPIRAFNALRVLQAHGTWTNEPNGLLADLTPLEGMNLAGLRHLSLENTKVRDLRRSRVCRLPRFALAGAGSYTTFRPSRVCRSHRSAFGSPRSRTFHRSRA